MNYLAIVPARGGSKGIPGKNLLRIAGKPLVRWTLEAAARTKELRTVVLTSDDDRILAVGRKVRRVRSLKRPPELATDKAPTEPAILHALKETEQALGCRYDAVVLLQPTCPLRSSADIREALRTFERTGADSLLSLTPLPLPPFFWKPVEGNWMTPANYDPRKRPRRQEVEPILVENGAIYVTRRDLLVEKNCRLGGNIAASYIPASRCFDLDEPDQIPILEGLLRLSGRRRKEGL